LLIKRLNNTMMTPIPKEMIFASLTCFDSVIGSFRKRRIKSLMMARAEELIPEERLDMDAASKPASTRPENPAGSPITINRGNRRSAPSMTDCPFISD